MGWVDATGRHEGWVQPVFGDGELGTATSSSAGVVWNAHRPTERVRPYSEITHLRVVCTCPEGWAGEMVAVADLPAEALDRRWMELTDVGEDLPPFLPAWRAHVGPAAQLAAMADAARAFGDAQERVEAAVAAARDAGATWEIIGTILGITKQGAQQRYGRSRED